MIALNFKSSIYIAYTEFIHGAEGNATEIFEVGWPDR
jgi:hypothetical protein